MKVKRKGKVYPSLPSPSSSPSKSSPYKDPDSVLKLLPVTTLALALSLPGQDREVLAYLIARSIFITTTKNPFSLTTRHPKTKYQNKIDDKHCIRKVPLFQCGCFDCYTRFWYRWDSSPNRDFIHQVIEAFEEHLMENECTKKHSIRGKRKGKVLMVGHFESAPDDMFLVDKPEISVSGTEREVVVMQEKLEGGDTEESHQLVCEEQIVDDDDDDDDEVTGDVEMEVVNAQASGCRSNVHKGLARKVLPDVVGLLNSRLWATLWSPGI